MSQISETTKTTYANNMRRLNNGKPITNYNFLKNTESILQKIEHLKPTTQRNYYISIVSTIKNIKDLDDVNQFYYDKMMLFNNNLKINNTKSDTQEENWITQEEVKKIFNDNLNNVKPLFLLKTLDEKQYNDLLHVVVLALYVLQSPRRNKDYQIMKVVKNINKIPTDEKYKNFNYFLLDEKKFLFYNYKTKGTYDLQEVPVNEELYTILISFLKFSKRKSCLLVNYNKEPLMQVNSITRILNKIFDKNIGVSMLRNIFLSDRFSDNYVDLQNIASNMGTSVSTIQNQYLKL